VSTWEERMAARAASRREAAERASAETPPAELRGELPPGQPDTARYWCTSCGLPDAPRSAHKHEQDPPCPRCGSRWRWYGRLADRDDTATEPPDGLCLLCYRWERSEWDHFGWVWRRACAWSCGCAHHADEVWLA